MGISKELYWSPNVHKFFSKLFLLFLMYVQSPNLIVVITKSLIQNSGCGYFIASQEMIRVEIDETMVHLKQVTRQTALLGRKETLVILWTQIALLGWREKFLVIVWSHWQSR